MIKKGLIALSLLMTSLSANAALVSHMGFDYLNEVSTISGEYTEITGTRDDDFQPGIFFTYGNWGATGGYVDFVLVSEYTPAAMWVFNAPDHSMTIDDLVAYESGNFGQFQTGGNVTRIEGYTDGPLSVVIGPQNLTEDVIRAGANVYDSWMEGYFSGVAASNPYNNAIQEDRFWFQARSPLFYTHNAILDRPEGTQSLQELAGLYDTDVPEPATAFLALIGAAGFLYRRKQAIK